MFNNLHKRPFSISSLKEKIFSISSIVVLKVQCKVRTEPKPEPYVSNLEAPIFSVHRAALKFLSDISLIVFNFGQYYVNFRLINGPDISSVLACFLGQFRCFT